MRRDELQDLGDGYLPAEIEERIEVATQIAEGALASASEVRVNFRWRREQLALVQEAALRVGVPYQTYMKQVVYEHAVGVLTAARGVAFEPLGDDRPRGDNVVELRKPVRNLR